MSSSAIKDWNDWVKGGKEMTEEGRRRKLYSMYLLDSVSKASHLRDSV